MAKKLTPQEQRTKDLIKRLIALIERMDKTREMRGAFGREIVADGIGVPRETLSRWVNWRVTPRGLSVAAIEHYLDRMEA